MKGIKSTIKFIAGVVGVMAAGFTQREAVEIFNEKKRGRADRLAGAFGGKRGGGSGGSKGTFSNRTNRSPYATQLLMFSSSRFTFPEQGKNRFSRTKIKNTFLHHIPSND